MDLTLFQVSSVSVFSGDPMRGIDFKLSANGRNAYMFDWCHSNVFVAVLALCICHILIDAWGASQATGLLCEIRDSGSIQPKPLTLRTCSLLLSKPMHRFYVSSLFQKMVLAGITITGEQYPTIRHGSCMCSTRKFCVCCSTDGGIPPNRMWQDYPHPTMACRD